MRILRSGMDIVGASLSNRRTVVMVVNDDATILDRRGGLRFFASRLAPTVGIRCMQTLCSAQNLLERAGSGRRSDEKPETAANIRDSCVIVDDHRQQAGSHNVRVDRKICIHRIDPSQAGR